MFAAIFCKIVFSDGSSNFQILFYDAILITYHCLGNGLVSDFAFRNIWQMMGGGQKDISNLLWLTHSLNTMFLNKDYIIVNLSLQLIPDLSQEFCWQHTG